MKKTAQILLQYAKIKYGKPFRSREKFEKWQKKQIHKHLKFVLKHSIYYRKLFNSVLKEKGINGWNEFPVITKKEMMENFNELNTRGIKKEEAFKIALKSEETRNFSPTIGDITIGLSSGTSGNRGLFLASEEERNKWVGTILAKVLPNGIMSKEKIAFFLRANSNLYESIRSKKISFHFYDLMESIEQHVQHLNYYQPSILVAPSSVLRLLSEQKESGTLQIQPNKIIAVAEVLEPLDQTFIEQQFNQRIHQIYQCTEGFLAHTCEHGTIHLNEDIIMIEKEFLNEENTKFSPIITDFTRKTQPIIRYKLNDILTIKKEKCECGSIYTAIEQIEGRCDDIFYFPHEEEEKEVMVFPDFIRRAIISSSLEIEEYKVIQYHPNEIEIQLKSKKYSKELEDKVNFTLELFLKEKKCKMPIIHFKEYIQEYGTKKLKRIERKIK